MQTRVRARKQRAKDSCTKPSFIEALIPTTFCPFYMKLLELFSGSGSMGKAFAEKGWEVTSLDLDPKTEATIKKIF